MLLEETRQKLLDAAIIIFNEDLSSPLEKVANRAGITRRTLHRYFKNRDELLSACYRDMHQICNRAMKDAMETSDEPLEQLRQWLFAAVDCGSKYAFLHKLLRVHGQGYFKIENIERMYDPFNKARKIIEILTGENRISQNLTFDWIAEFFLGVVTACVNSLEGSKITTDRLKELSWYSFSRGIGV